MSVYSMGLEPCVMTLQYQSTFVAPKIPLWSTSSSFFPL